MTVKKYILSLIIWLLVVEGTVWLSVDQNNMLWWEWLIAGVLDLLLIFGIGFKTLVLTYEKMNLIKFINPVLGMSMLPMMFITSNLLLAYHRNAVYLIASTFIISMVPLFFRNPVRK